MYYNIRQWRMEVNSGLTFRFGIKTAKVKIKVPNDSTP